VRVNACLNTVKIEWLKMVWKGFVNSDIDEKAMPASPSPLGEWVRACRLLVFVL